MIQKKFPVIIQTQLGSNDSTVVSTARHEIIILYLLQEVADVEKFTWSRKGGNAGPPQ